jgi:AraC family transcriptional regulator, positive regulator of tynA and feaB
MEAIQIGGLRMTHDLCVSAAEDLFFLALQLEGTGSYRQDGREARLAPGDFTLCAAARPYEVTADHSLVTLIPGDLLRRHLTSPDDVVAVRMSGSRGMTGVLSNFIKNLWASRAATSDAGVALRMSYTLLDLIAAAYSVTPHARHEQSTLVAAHRVRILSYIEAHLRDPQLSPTTVAQACKITARYLHHLFTAGSETVTQYIQRRRLEECARALLVAAPVRGRLVTEIAFDYGFNSLTHFGRVFRHQFGLTPSEYRRAARSLTDQLSP